MSRDKPIKPKLADRFSEAFWGSRVWRSMTWLGVPILKTPCDLWVYQELIVAKRPDVIVETGTAEGGSALFFASLCDLIGHGEVITVDLRIHEKIVGHPRATYIEGNSVSPETIIKVREVCAGRTGMVILDSLHSSAHVAAELAAYATLVAPGGHLIVEDCSGSEKRDRRDPLAPVIDRFLAEHGDFRRDRSCERFGMTFCRGGFLQRAT